MNLITSTLNDFYHCCKIPVKAISYELNEIYKIGYNEEFETYFPIKDIYTLVHSGEEYLNHSIKVSEYICYKIVNISKPNIEVFLYLVLFLLVVQEKQMTL